MKTSCFLATAILTAIGWHSAISADTDDVLFYASFDEDARAVAKGSGEGVEKGGLLEFKPGHRGKALASGENLGHVSYEVDGNLPSDAGSIEMWIRPENWEGSDSAQHDFLQAGGRGELVIYKHIAPGNGSFLIGAEGTPESRDVVYHNISSWQAGEWHQVVVTWDKNEAKFYVDGVPSNPKVNPPIPVALSGRFFVGDQVSKGPGDAQTLIDEVYIYGRPLSEEEVAWTYAHALDRPAGGGVAAGGKSAP